MATTDAAAGVTSVVETAPPAARRRRVASLGLIVGAVLLGVILLAALFLPLRYSPTAVNSAATSQAPSGAHWFGTDKVGEDVFARTVRAARADLPLALGGTALASLVGILGGLAVSAKSRWSEWVMRGLDAFQSLPLLILTLALVVIAHNNLYMVAVAIALVSGPFYIRIVRSQAIVVRESRYVEAALASGASPGRVMLRHMLPNLRTIILAQTALTGAVALLVVASLSFLGVGVTPPTPSWGSMIRSGSTLLVTGQWWTVLFPGLALFLCIISFNLIADGLRDLAGRKPRGAQPVTRTDPILEVQDLCTSYASSGSMVAAVKDVSFVLHRGRRYGLVGESGSGKSSIIRAILGLVRPPNQVTATTLRFNGDTDLLSLPRERLRRLRGAEIGYVGQNPFGALHPVLSVGEQYHQFLKAHGQGRRKSEHRARAAAVLEELGLPDPEAVLRGHAGQLSGGMAQRVVLGFSTVLDPQFVIADEPTTALDVTVQRQVLDLLARQTEQSGRTLLLVTHDLAVVAQYCDEVIVLRHGRVVETGPVREVFLRPLHPYTEALLSSVPRVGVPPRPMARTGAAAVDDGCQFAPLCPLVQDDCLQERPALVEQSVGRAAACHHVPPHEQLIAAGAPGGQP